MNALRMTAAVWLATAGLTAAQETGNHAFLGVATVPTADGERVVSVAPNSPAAEAGLKAGDVLLKLDNQAIDARHSLRAQMNDKKASQAVALTFRDASGTVQSRNVTLRERPAPGPSAPRSQYRPFNDDGPAFDDVTQMQFMQPPGPRPMLGVTVIDADPDLRQRLNLGQAPGVMISEVRPNTPAAEAKLQVNDLVQSVNGKAVTNAAELSQLIAGAKPDVPVKLKIFRGGQTLDVSVKVKTMAMPSVGAPSGFPGMMGAGPNPDLVNEVNQLRARVQALEARIQVLEQRAGVSAPGRLPSNGAGATSKYPPPPRTGSEPDR